MVNSCCCGNGRRSRSRGRRELAEVASTAEVWDSVFTFLLWLAHTELPEKEWGWENKVKMAAAASPGSCSSTSSDWVVLRDGCLRCDEEGLRSLSYHPALNAILAVTSRGSIKVIDGTSGAILQASALHGKFQMYCHFKWYVYKGVITRSSFSTSQMIFWGLLAAVDLSDCQV